MSSLTYAVLYMIAVIVILCIPFAIAIGMTQLVQLVDRTQQWMFDNRIRDRLADDLRTAVLRKAERDNNNLTDSISVKYSERENMNGLHKQLRNEQAERRKWASRGKDVPNAQEVRQISVGTNQVNVKSGSGTGGSGTMKAAVKTGIAINGKRGNPRRETNREKPEAVALARVVERQLNAAMNEKLSEWLADSGCQNATVKVGLQRGQAGARLEWSMSCGRGASCVSRRHVADLNDVKLTGAQRNNLRVVLSEHNVVRLTIFCRARLLAEHFLSVSEMHSLIGATKQAKL